MRFPFTKRTPAQAQKQEQEQTAQQQELASNFIDPDTNQPWREIPVKRPNRFTTQDAYAAGLIIIILNWVREQVAAPLTLVNKQNEVIVTEHPAISLWNSAGSPLLGNLAEDLLTYGYSLLVITEDNQLKRYAPRQFMVTQIKDTLRIRLNIGRTPEPERMLYLRYQQASDSLRGVSPLRGNLFKELELDEAAVYGAVRAMRRPDLGLAVTPVAGQTLTEQQQDDLSELLKEFQDNPDTTESLVLGEPADIKQLDSNAARANFAQVRRSPQTMVLAAYGINASTIGVEAGVDANRTGTPYAAMRAESYNRAVAPLQRKIAAQLSEWLLPFYNEDPDRWEFVFDNSDNAILQAEAELLADDEEARKSNYFDRIFGVPSSILSDDEKRALILAYDDELRQVLDTANAAPPSAEPEPVDNELDDELDESQSVIQ